MTSGIVYFEEILENVKDATGYESTSNLRDKLRRFIFNTERDIGAGGMVVRKKKTYTKGDGRYDGKNIIMPYDFIGESSYGALSDGVLNGNVMTLNVEGATEIEVEYIGFVLDNNGNPFTTRNHLEACVLYAQMRLYSAKVFTGSGSRRMYRDIKQEYNDEVMASRGNDAFPTEEEWNAIGATMNGGAFEAYSNCLMTSKLSTENMAEDGTGALAFNVLNIIPSDLAPIESVSPISGTARGSSSISG